MVTLVSMMQRLLCRRLFAELREQAFDQFAARVIATGVGSACYGRSGIRPTFSVVVSPSRTWMSVEYFWYPLLTASM